MLLSFISIPSFVIMLALTLTLSNSSVMSSSLVLPSFNKLIPGIIKLNLIMLLPSGVKLANPISFCNTTSF